MDKVSSTRKCLRFFRDDKSAGPVAAAVGSHAREPASNLYRPSVIVVAQSLSLCRPSRRHLYHRHRCPSPLPLPPLPLTVFVRASSRVCVCARVYTLARRVRPCQSVVRARACTFISMPNDDNNMYKNNL